MNQNYTLLFSKKIVFGAGTAMDLAKYLPDNITSLLLVTGKHFDAMALTGILQEKGCQVTHVHSVLPEPPLEEVDRIIEAGRTSKADAVLAIGGGSVIDAAKAAAAIIPREGFCIDYFTEKRAVKNKGLFFIAVPTSAGTGAEMTNNSVLTDTASQVKKSLRSPFMIADIALIDPLLTLSCPPSVTAASGLDAFIQAIEAYTSPKASAASKALSLRAAVQIFHHIHTAYSSPGDLDARTEMAEGSMLSGMAFSQCGLGAVHGLAHPVGSLLKVPHGIACAVIMPYVFEWNMPLCESSYAELARACGVGNTAKEFVDAVRELASKLCVPKDFSDYGMNETHFDFIVKNCRSASMNQNPRPMNDEDVISMLRVLCGKL